jgi:hypothetical protein
VKREKNLEVGKHTEFSGNRSFYRRKNRFSFS